MKSSYLNSLPPMGASICTITPEDVSRWTAEGRLENNFRRINQSRVSQYSDDMVRGRWKMNAEAIKFNDEGMVVDGQHRLMACVDSGVPFETMVYRGDIDTTSVDTGQKRTVAQRLTYLGYKNASTIGSIAVLVDANERRGNIKSSGVVHRHASTTRILDLVERNRDRFRDAAAATHKLRSIGVPRSLAGFIWYEGSKVNRDAATEFLTQACNGCDTSGDGLSSGNPAFVFYRYMVNIGSSRKVSTNVMRAHIVIAANSWAARSEIKILRWTELTNTGKPSQFPVLSWYEDLEGWSR